MNGTPTLCPPEQVPAKLAAPLCGVSVATWHRLNSARKIPAPVRLGGRVLWRVQELRDWMGAGCPDRKTWEALKAAGGNNKK